MATKYTTYTFPAFMPMAILAARQLTQREKLLKTLAGFTLILYTSLTLLVAVPLCRDYYSGKNLATALRWQVHPQDLVLIYGDYKASLSFYLHKFVYKLESAAAIEADKPQAMSWNSKNVMPYLAVEKLPADKNLYLILDERKVDAFPQELNRQEWQLLHKTTAGSIYYRGARE